MWDQETDQAVRKLAEIRHRISNGGGRKNAVS